MKTSRILLIVGLALIFLGGVALYSSHKAQAPMASIIAEPAPAAVDPSWETYSDDLLSFRFPATFTTTYIHPVSWPPEVTIPPHGYMCLEWFTVNGREYCFSHSTEGAAGSRYTNYTFVTAMEDEDVTLSFTLREVQCANYDDPQKSECEQEQEDFNVNALADRILQTVELK